MRNRTLRGWSWGYHLLCLQPEPLLPDSPKQSKHMEQTPQKQLELQQPCLLHGQLCSPKTVVLPEAASAGSLSQWQLRKLSCPLPFCPGPVLMLRSEDGKSSGKEQRRGRPGFPPSARASVPSGLLLAGEQLGRLSLLLR